VLSFPFFFYLLLCLPLPPPCISGVFIRFGFFQVSAPCASSHGLPSQLSLGPNLQSPYVPLVLEPGRILATTFPSLCLIVRRFPRTSSPLPNKAACMFRERFLGGCPFAEDPTPPTPPPFESWPALSFPLTNNSLTPPTPAPINLSNCKVFFSYLPLRDPLKVFFLSWFSHIRPHRRRRLVSVTMSSD